MHNLIDLMEINNNRNIDGKSHVIWEQTRRLGREYYTGRTL